MPEKISVLFVCLGNICRSTMAEGIFRDLAKQPEYKDKIGKIDSCGTGAYHTGDPPDDRTMVTLEKNGITDYDHSARKVRFPLYPYHGQPRPPPERQANIRQPLHPQFRSTDLDTFDYVFAMDKSNLSDLQRQQRGNPDSKARVMLYGEFSGRGGKAAPETVGDPYYGGAQGFEKAFEQCSRFGRNFLEEVVVGEGK